MRIYLLFAVGLLSITILFLGFANKGLIRDFIFDYQKGSLPEPKALFYTNTHDREYLYKNGKDSEKDLETEIFGTPEKINLAVPFTSQAPHANWDLPYKETCEEASLLMVARYKKGKQIASPEDADEEIWKLIEFQNQYFGYYQDTTAEQTAEIARKHYGFEDTEVIYNFTVEDIKRELTSGNPVIVPAYGRGLGNPYFRRPGPLYHMLVIRGYTKNKFITNDPGTRRGEEFAYDYEVLLNAAHDWNGGDVENGRRAMIVIKR